MTTVTAPMRSTRTLPLSHPSAEGSTEEMTPPPTTTRALQALQSSGSGSASLAARVDAARLAGLTCVWAEPKVGPTFRTGRTAQEAR